MRIVSLVIGLLALAVSAAAQGTVRPPTQPTATQATADTGQGTIRGRIVIAGGSPVSYAVRITLQNSRGTQESSYTDNQGQFEIRSLAPGDYTLEVEADKLRFEVSTESVTVYRGSPSIVTITLKEKAPTDRRTLSGAIVSVGELGANVPEKAKREFEKASRAGKENNSVEAITHLRKAIALYPDFMMAHNDLGAQLLEVGNLDEAATELRRAIALNTNASYPFLNLGIVLVKQRRFAEAADVLKKALSLESNSPTAKLYMGLAYMGLSEMDDAERELAGAYSLGGKQYSLALFHLGEIYMNKGDRVRAQQSFEAYLRAEPNAANAAQVRKLISILR